MNIIGLWLYKHQREWSYLLYAGETSILLEDGYSKENAFVKSGAICYA